MTQYLRQPVFWVSVLIVAVAINFAWNAFTGKGKVV